MTQGERVMSAPEFDGVWAAEYVPLVGFLKWLGADQQEAEDAASQAFLELWRQTKPVTQHRAWLRTVAERAFWKSDVKIINQARAHERLTSPPVPDPAKTIIHRQEVAEVMAHVQMLPLEQRRVFAWRMDGFEFDEIAEILGKPTATIRSHYRHARDRLKELAEIKSMNERHRHQIITAQEGGMDDERSRVE